MKNADVVDFKVEAGTGITVEGKSENGKMTVTVGNDYFKANVTRLSDKVDNMDRDYRAGIAGSNAAASLPQVYLPGKSMVAAAAGTFKGQNALAVGYSSISDNGKLIWKAQANLNSRADVGASVGIGYLW